MGCIKNTVDDMPRPPVRSARPPRDTLSVKLGGWFEAHATGSGVIAVPVIVVLVLAAAVARLWLG